MKIELINENQIKCTLSRSDLAYHQIKISELAYGTEKTKALFQDMMDQAFNEFGFEAGESLMIEAIPVSMDCIILMITNVDAPEELDQRFSGLSRVSDFIISEENGDEEALDALIDNLSDDRFLEDGLGPAPSKPARHAMPSKPARKPQTVPAGPLERIFSFDNLETVIDFAHKSASSFKGRSSLYKSPEDGRYYMVLTDSARSVNVFGRICNLALEYGCKEPSGFARSAFISEHFDVIIAEDALQKLSDV
ncbi:MAG: adaptor protein MecA [Lachnospiraceae bacterium]|jgi:adapter protein MecA 1/2